MMYDLAGPSYCELIASEKERSKLRSLSFDFQNPAMDVGAATPIGTVLPLFAPEEAWKFPNLAVLRLDCIDAGFDFLISSGSVQQEGRECSKLDQVCAQLPQLHTLRLAIQLSRHTGKLNLTNLLQHGRLERLWVEGCRLVLDNDSPTSLRSLYLAGCYLSRETFGALVRNSSERWAYSLHVRGSC